MPSDPPQFDDPGLKSALQTVQGKMKAPPQLRDRLKQRLAQERTAAAPQPRTQSRLDFSAGPMFGSDEPETINKPAETAAKKQPARAGGPPVPVIKPPTPQNDQADRGPIPIRPAFRIGGWLALAASVILILGGGIGVMYYRQIQEEKAEYAANDELLDAMIDAQQDAAAGKSGGASLPAPLSDPAALSATAGRELGRTIPVANFSRQGWRLDSASFCDVHKLASVAFNFSRAGGKQHMTVLSMPASAWANGKDGDKYDLPADGHAIAGFIKGGSLTCVVGDTSLSRDEAVALRDQMRG